MMAGGKVTEVLRTRRLEVVDEDDVVRLVLRCDRDGVDDAALVEVYEPKGGLSMLLVSDGDVSFCEWWQRGNPVIRLRSCRNLSSILRHVLVTPSVRRLRWAR